MPWTNRWLHRRDSNEQLTQPTRTQHTLLNDWFHKIYASCTSSIQHVWTPTPNTPGSGGGGGGGGGVGRHFNHCLLLPRSKAEPGTPSTHKGHFSWKPVVAEASGRSVWVCKCVLWWESHRDRTLLNCPGSHSFLFFSSRLLSFSPPFYSKRPKAEVIPVKTPFGFWPLPKVPSPQSRAFTGGPRRVPSSK